MNPLKKIVPTLLAVLCSQVCAEITISETGSHVGEAVTVRGTVAQVSTIGSGMTFINFGRPHPDSEFTAVVRAGTPGFGDLTSLQGKEVKVEGTIELHKGRPQIVLSSPDKIHPADGTSPVTANVAASPAPDTPSESASLAPSASSTPEENATHAGYFLEPRAPSAPGALEEFKVPLTEEEKRMAGSSPAGVKPQEASVGIMLPAGFDPSKPQKVLVVFSTDDNGGDHLKAMPRFGGIAARNGWVAIAATGPVLENKLSPEWHAAMIYAGLRALEEKYPRAKTWRFFTGGNSGGGLRSAMMSCAILKKGYPVEGVFMGGAGDERFSAGLGIFRPDRSKVRNLAVYLAIGKNDPMINAARADYVAGAVKKQGIKNIRRDSYDGGHGMNEESFTKALEWFSQGAK